MREIRTYGSVGGLGGQPPRSTRNRKRQTAYAYRAWKVCPSGLGGKISRYIRALSVLRRTWIDEKLKKLRSPEVDGADPGLKPSGLA